MDSNSSMLLMTHILKSSRSSDPEIAIPSCKSIAADKPDIFKPPVVKMCKDCIREVFNQNRLWERIIEQGYRFCLRYKGPVSHPDIPIGSRSLLIECYHPSQPERILIHCYWDPIRKEVTGTRTLDPKNIIQGGFHFDMETERKAQVA